MSNTLTRQMNKIWGDIVEPSFDTLGIGIYDSRIRRFVVVTGVTAALLWITKPSGVFKEDGSPREWTLTNPTLESTVVPWLGVSLFIGGMSVLLV